jgi:quercetin dioxygenase-like cupin family protein
MFLNKISTLAKFAPDKMGKSTLAQGDFLLAGLNSFEPGQEHASHAHAGQDKLYVILEGSGVVRIG